MKNLRVKPAHAGLGFLIFGIFGKVAKFGRGARILDGLWQLDFLESLNAAYEGYSSGTKAIMESRDSLSGIMGQLSGCRPPAASVVHRVAWGCAYRAPIVAEACRNSNFVIYFTQYPNSFFSSLC